MPALSTVAPSGCAKRTNPSTLTDMERAVRFLYLQRTAFGGKVAERSLRVDRRTRRRLDVTKPGPVLEELHERLARGVDEQLPYADLIRRYNGRTCCSTSTRPIGAARTMMGPACSSAPTSSGSRTS